MGSPEDGSAAQCLLNQDSGFETHGRHETVALRSQGRDATQAATGSGQQLTCYYHCISYQAGHKTDISQPVKLRNKLSDLEGNL